MKWHLLTKALELYQEMGYQYIDVPWIIDNDITKITCQDEKRIFSTKDGDLVGSAEQSFLQLESDHKLYTGKFVALTPCFRNEEVLDDLHQKYFMKVELYNNEKTDKETLQQTIKDAKKVFDFLMEEETGFNGPAFVKSVKTETEYDLMLHDVEIGSYGIRQYQNLKWIYGTGIAEPRFSKALKGFSKRK